MACHATDASTNTASIAIKTCDHRSYGWPNLFNIGIPSQICFPIKENHEYKDYFNFLQVSCTEHVQAIQRYHIESRRFDDIAYNFLVGGDGFVYVGRGWDFQGAHTKGFNANSICIAFIGTFDNYAPTEPQLDAAKKLIEEGVQLKKLPEDYALYGHRQLTPTQSPGTVLFNIIKTWEHWTEVVSRR